ncbi:stage V sporulation protein D [Lederbergia sp. NSJ-179]|uniref:stage V sporulation protein D n=1 Tax=Lederbergia sp. NSJ-179 TaxID=2931402 RepID=UPI001FCF92C9|nr:stage V sporulation protein D [Lederbergia sp. NSJ-179]MCJ7843345.1 stage V sporulation protein D [Lederbergia sp. NSJ-179]
MRVSNVTVRKRLIVVLIAGFVIMFVIGIRLGYLQFILGGSLSDRALELWSRDIPFEGKRGEIVDRNGVSLVQNLSAPTVYVIPRQIKDPVKTAEELHSILKGNKEEIYRQVTKDESIVRIQPDGRKISNEKAKQIKKLNIPGVFIGEDYKRHYPFGNNLSHVLGFTGIDNQGLMGLELFYNENLSGEKGRVSLYSDAKGNKISSLSDEYDPPKAGLDLKLTVDSKVQSIVERELDHAVAKYNPDGALAIAMNPNTGEILAMSNRPNFNPASYKDYSAEIYNQNRPIWSQYEPGSTFKIITLASALEEKVVDLEEDTFFDPGYIMVEGQKIRSWKKGGHGQQTFLEGVQNSSNPGFVLLGQRLGKEKLFSYIDKFGFGKKTGIDLQGEGTGILFPLERVGPVELATTAFGQGVSVTPIQQVTAVSAAINGGYLYKPYIAKEWIDPKTKEVAIRNSPHLKQRVISEETSKQVRYALENVVAKGTGKNAYVEGYRVGGKTGTAQKVVDGKYLKNNYIVSFLGFAPADDPQIVVYVAIDNPKDTLQFGGVVAAPIVGTIIEDSLSSMGVKKRQDQIEKETTLLDEEFIAVPNLIGKSKKDIYQSFYDLKIDATGEGEMVLNQIPKAGSKVKSGATIRLLLGNK